MSVDWDDIEILVHYPHLFGHYLGYDKLVDLHSEWIKEAWIYNNIEAMQAHRNSFKTTAVIIVGALWYLLFFNPNETCLYVRKVAEDASKITRTIRELFESREVRIISKFIYGVEDLKTDNWSNHSITLSIKSSKSPEGNFDSRGTTGSITGSHYGRVFPDDFVNLKDRTSKAERERTKGFIRELTNIKKDEGRVFYLGTPWHKKDAWEIIPKPALYPIGSVPIIGYSGDQLENKKIELRRGTTASLFAINYELKHIADEDKIFTDPLRDAWPEEAQRVSAYLDPAYQGKNTTALTMIAQKDGKDHIRGWDWPDDVEAKYTTIVNLLNEFKCGTLYVESNADKGYSARDLQKMYPIVVPVNETTNKHIKIVSFLKQYWSQLYFAHDCQDEYLNQILDYEEGQEPDDAPDSAASLLREMKIKFDFVKIGPDGAIGQKIAQEGPGGESFGDMLLNLKRREKYRGHI